MKKILLIANSSCQIGNSSSALREGSFLGVPVVNVGTRQHNRECGKNVIHVNYDSDEIKNGIYFQINHGKYESSKIFGDGKAGERIAEILATANFRIQKKLHF